MRHVNISPMDPHKKHDTKPPSGDVDLKFIMQVQWVVKEFQIQKTSLDSIISRVPFESEIGYGSSGNMIGISDQGHRTGATP